MTIHVGGLSRLLGTALLGMVVPWIGCAGGSEDESLHQAPSVAPRQHAPAIIRERHGTSTSSSNWSGYAVTGPDGSVSDVKGSWIVPAISNCSSTSPNQYASFWVGIDGYDSSTVEQIGTDSDCQNGSRVYYAWYEFYPHFSYGVPFSIPIQPGDVISAAVSYAGGKFTVSITDEKTKQTWSTSQKMPNAKRSSAEWIIEAPSSGGVLPLADFGTVDFGFDYTGVPPPPASPTCWATVSGTSGAIGTFANFVNITMVDSNNHPMSEPSGLSTDGTSFTDAFEPSGP